LMNIDLSSVREIGGSFTIISNSALLDISAPNITQIKGDLSINNNANLINFNFQSLTSIDGQLIISSNPKLATLNLKNVIEVTDTIIMNDISILYCSSLSTYLQNRISIDCTQVTSTETETNTETDTDTATVPETTPDIDENTICSNLSCCLAQQNPNPQTGSGYYEFWQDCLPDGGLHCISNTGCRLCYREVGFLTNVGNRPVCERFAVPMEEFICDDQACCEDKQHPNPLNGVGYMDFSEPCLNGGLHCIGNTGCRLCYKEVSGGVNVGERPLCADQKI